MVTNLIKKVPEKIDLFIYTKYNTSSYLFVFGYLGYLKYKFTKKILLDTKFRLVKLVAKKSLFTTYLKILNNFYLWTSLGVHKHISLIGVGFKFKLFKNKLLLVVGYSHILKITIPKNIKLHLYNNKNIELKGLNLEALNLFIDLLKRLKKFDPYKGKGLFVEGTNLKRKTSTKTIF